MDWASIIGRLAGGFAVKAAAAGAVLWVALEVWSYVSTVFEGVSNVLQ